MSIFDIATPARPVEWLIAQREHDAIAGKSKQSRQGGLF